MLLANTCGDDAQESANERKLTGDEARRIAAGIAQIPERLPPPPNPGKRRVSNVRNAETPRRYTPGTDAYRSSGRLDADRLAKSTPWSVRDADR
jgi:hypothetical protein